VPGLKTKDEIAYSAEACSRNRERASAFLPNIFRSGQLALPYAVVRRPEMEDRAGRIRAGVHAVPAESAAWAAVGAAHGVRGAYSMRMGAAAVGGMVFGFGNPCREAAAVRHGSGGRDERCFARILS